MDAGFLGSGSSLDYWFPPTPYSYFEAVRGVNYGSVANNKTTVAGFGKSAGCVLMADGRVYCIPYIMAGTQTKIYDPSTNSAVTAGGTFAVGDSYVGGALLPDGRVFLIPRNNAASQALTGKIYNPTLDTLTTCGGVWNIPHYGGCLLPDGRVFCCSAIGGTRLGTVYDPVANTTAAINSPVTFESQLTGAVLLPNGLVYTTTRLNNQPLLFNPVTNSAVVAGGPPTGTNNFSGVVLLTDGRVYLVPNVTNTAWIYDPVANTHSAAGGVIDGSSSWHSGVLLPNGKVYLFPINGSNVAHIYNPVTDTVEKPGITLPSGAGGVLLRDGRVFCAPFLEANSGDAGATIYGSAIDGIPLSRVLSSYDNKW